jgi:hypothetical protein
MRLSPFLLFLAGVMSAQSVGTFSATGGMIAPRFAHTATLLPKGKVLVAGGSTLAPPSPAVASAELYDPSTGTFSMTGNMIVARREHTATLLPDGRVLIAGGDGGGSASGTAELYDPHTGSFTLAGSLNPAPVWRRSVLLADGRVFIAGGAKAELYDPATGVFTASGAYAVAGRVSMYTTTLLADGRVLVIGAAADCMAPELYDPVTGTFALTGPLTGCDNIYTAATLLGNGKVLLVGNIDSNYISAAEVYDPVNGTFTRLDGAPVATSSPATLLSDGTVLVTGGTFLGGGGNDEAWIYDPATRNFLPARMSTGRVGHTATLLPDGSVLIVGGIGPRAPSIGLPPTGLSVLATAEVYTPLTRQAAPALFSFSDGQGAIWHAPTGEIASPTRPAAAGEVLSMYTGALLDAGLIPPQVAIGGRLAEILFFGAAPGYAGYFQVNFRVPDGIAAGSAVPVRLTYLGRSSNEVTIGVR